MATCAEVVERLRKENKALKAELEDTSSEDKWRELALQFDHHRIQAMALIRAVAAGNAGIEDCEKFAALPPPEAIRSRVAVVPERKRIPRILVVPFHEANGWNNCLDELARLNGKTVSEGFLYRIAETLDDVCHGSALEKELRALLDEGKEVGSHDR